jgi:hypothetical protein
VEIKLHFEPSSGGNRCIANLVNCCILLAIKYLKKIAGLRRREEKVCSQGKSFSTIYSLLVVGTDKSLLYLLQMGEK